MKIQIVKNKYINAALLLMLFSAIVHMTILFVLTLLSGNLQLLNYFNILDLNYLIPNFLSGLSSDIISFIVVVLIYLLILKYNKV